MDPFYHNYQANDHHHPHFAHTPLAPSHHHQHRTPHRPSGYVSHPQSDNHIVSAVKEAIGPDVSRSTLETLAEVATSLLQLSGGKPVEVSNNVETISLAQSNHIHSTIVDKGINTMTATAAEVAQDHVEDPKHEQIMARADVSKITTTSSPLICYKRPAPASSTLEARPKRRPGTRPEPDYIPSLTIPSRAVQYKSTGVSFNPTYPTPELRNRLLAFEASKGRYETLYSRVKTDKTLRTQAGHLLISYYISEKESANSSFGFPLVRRTSGVAPSTSAHYVPPSTHRIPTRPESATHTDPYSTKQPLHAYTFSGPGREQTKPTPHSRVPSYDRPVPHPLNPVYPSSGAGNMGSSSLPTLTVYPQDDRHATAPVKTTSSSMHVKVPLKAPPQYAPPVPQPEAHQHYPYRPHEHPHYVYPTPNSSQATNCSRGDLWNHRGECRGCPPLPPPPPPTFPQSRPTIPPTPHTMTGSGYYGHAAPHTPHIHQHYPIQPPFQHRYPEVRPHSYPTHYHRQPPTDLRHSYGSYQRSTAPPPYISASAHVHGR